jgi:hypothetical protein
MFLLRIAGCGVGIRILLFRKCNLENDRDTGCPS